MEEATDFEGGEAAFECRSMFPVLSSVTATYFDGKLLLRDSEEQGKTPTRWVHNTLDFVAGSGEMVESPKQIPPPSVYQYKFNECSQHECCVEIDV